jgi:UDP-N-acetyl-D-mannosaminuronic acid transferase (WecB/TagA/CpsF family)
MLTRIVNFKKIKFYECSYKYVKKILFEKKGYLVIPAASALSEINNKSYYEALRKSTIAIFDSGYFCLSLLCLKFIKVKKFSGFKFIKKFINDSSLKKFKILLLEPSLKSANNNQLYLKSKKFIFIKNYVCPIYSKNTIRDLALIKLISDYKPAIIVINIGGGIQELLANYINNKLKKKYVIICSGAALSFHSGGGAKINTLVDALYIGWFFRILDNPRVFIMRLILSLKLFKIVYKSNIKISYE